MQDSNQLANKEESREKLISFFSLLKSTWQFYHHRFLDFTEMYIWGLFGAIPLLIIGLIILGFSFLGLDSALLRFIFVILIILALLYFLYYSIRAHIGIILLIKNEKAKVKPIFIETKKFFRSYLNASVNVGIYIFFLTILFIIPGIIFYIYWFFTTLLVVLEEIKKPMEAIKRSKNLVKGYWWAVAGRLILIFFIYLIVLSIIMLPAAINIDPVTKIETFKYLSQDLGQVYQILANLIGALLSPILVVFSYFLYKDILAKKK